MTPLVFLPFYTKNRKFTTVFTTFYGSTRSDRDYGQISLVRTGTEEVFHTGLEQQLWFYDPLHLNLPTSFLTLRVLSLKLVGSPTLNEWYRGTDVNNLIKKPWKRAKIVTFLITNIFTIYDFPNGKSKDTQRGRGVVLYPFLRHNFYRFILILLFHPMCPVYKTIVQDQLDSF